ncbi:SctD/MshK family protein [Rhizobium giardinii]|uniref:YscD/Y4YQ C-terminal domain-containing protein n=1 Tax=Rhizobium giardinii TaxID=56731 RepID=A0A7W8UBT9_9HYPH|nr:hypothetical protein [Rhizobium giardinii]MBB5536486.1 hypothetical protein [Rhizobium giardinii]
MRKGPLQPSIVSAPTTGGQLVPDGPKLRITRGGRASVHTLSEGTYTIGGGPACDLVILNLEPEPALLLTVTENAGQPAVMAEALRDDVQAAGRPLRPGEPTALVAGGVIRFADVECVIEGLASPVVRAFRPSRKVAAAGLLALAAAILLLGMRPDSDRSGSTEMGKISVPAPQPTTDFIVTELKEAIRLAHLQIGVVSVENGAAIHIGEGSLPLDLASRTRLEGILSAVGRRSPVPVVDVTTLSSGLSGFVAAASYAPLKFVVGNDGRRYREGDTVSGDWHIKEIQPGKMVVARGDETDTISFNPEPGMNLRLARTADDGGA